jgi:DNA-binding transcriptional MerR regulator
LAEYRVDELARAAETSVRNVRVYQERGLLPPPRRVGRTGVYTEAHLARLRLIRLLLQRGYTFATIGELISAWSTGQGIAELLGFEDVIAVPWSDETPGKAATSDLAAGLGGLSPEELTRAVKLGFVEVDTDEAVHIPSPRLLEAGVQMVSAGVPLGAVLDLAEAMQSQLEQIARQMFRTFDRHVIQEGRSDGDVTTALIQLRPFAQQAVHALLAMALDRESERVLERRATRAQGSTVVVATDHDGSDDGDAADSSAADH